MDGAVEVKHPVIAGKSNKASNFFMCVLYHKITSQVIQPILAILPDWMDS